MRCSQAKKKKKERKPQQFQQIRNQAYFVKVDKISAVLVLFFLPVLRTHTYTVQRGPQRTPIAHILITSVDNKISDMCASSPASNTVFSTITKPIKALMVSNENLKTYLLSHINRMYKQNVDVLLQEWEACLESSIYGFVSLNRS